MIGACPAGDRRKLLAKVNHKGERFFDTLVSPRHIRVMQMELGKQTARDFFEELGFHVDDIPETDTKRADLDVDDGDQQYIVEVKQKLDTGSQLTVLHNSYPGSDRKITREPHSASNRLDGILKDGRKQLEATPAGEAVLRLLFVLFTGPNADMFVRRALYTFYGVQDVIPVSESGDGLNCVYFHNSFSFSSPYVDGLLLMENDGLLLCLNEFSSRCDILRHSQLALQMGMAVYDPANFDEDDGKVVLRSTISRTDDGAILDELERQSGVRYDTITLNRHNL